VWERAAACCTRARAEPGSNGGADGATEDGSKKWVRADVARTCCGRRVSRRWRVLEPDTMLQAQLTCRAPPQARCSLRPRRVASAAARCSAAAAPPPVRSSTHAVAGGVKLEVLQCAAHDAAAASGKPALCFLHGSSHASWCWAEHFLPHFAAAGYDAYALSMRGHVRAAWRVRVAAWPV
jgi:hypothetical protein